MPTKLTYCVYILLSLYDHDFYIGFSEDLQGRLSDHFNGRAQSTAPRRPLELIHCEYYRDKGDALRREKYLKTTKGKCALKLMLRDTLDGLRT